MAVVTRFVNAANRHDADGVAACLHGDFDSIQPIYPTRNFRGADQVRRNWQAIFDAEPGFRLTVLRSAQADNTVWLELHGAGQDAEVAGVFVMGVEGDRVRWARIYSALVEQPAAPAGSEAPAPPAAPPRPPPSPPAAPEAPEVAEAPAAEVVEVEAAGTTGPWGRRGSRPDAHVVVDDVPDAPVAAPARAADEAAIEAVIAEDEPDVAYGAAGTEPDVAYGAAGTEPDTESAARAEPAEPDAPAAPASDFGASAIDWSADEPSDVQPDPPDGDQPVGAPAARRRRWGRKG
jgi:ketosteroid isomerase-like protein